MSLPAGVKIGPGRRLSVSQRGYFTRFPDGSTHFVACRFAGAAQVCERVGYELPLSRKKPAPGEPDNFVHTLQLAGDPTPKTGSTLGMLRKALLALLPDAPISMGWMSDAEIFEALRNGATISIGADCGKWPVWLKRYVGRAYNGGHIIAFDDVRGDPGAEEVALTDPMHAPAKLIKPRWVRWADVAPSLSRTPKGIVVTIGYEGAVQASQEPPEPTTEELKAQIVVLKAANVALAEDKAAAIAEATRWRDVHAADVEDAQRIINRV